MADLCAQADAILTANDSLVAASAEAVAQAAREAGKPWVRQRRRPAGAARGPGGGSAWTTPRWAAAARPGGGAARGAPGRPPGKGAARGVLQRAPRLGSTRRPRPPWGWSSPRNCWTPSTTAAERQRRKAPCWGLFVLGRLSTKNGGGGRRSPTLPAAASPCAAPGPPRPPGAAAQGGPAPPWAPVLSQGGRTGGGPGGFPPPPRRGGGFPFPEAWLSQVLTAFPFPWYARMGLWTGLGREPPRARSPKTAPARACPSAAGGLQGLFPREHTPSPPGGRPGPARAGRSDKTVWQAYSPEKTKRGRSSLTAYGCTGAGTPAPASS